MKKNIQTRFDIYEPHAGHRERFIHKLESHTIYRQRAFRPELIAAVILIFFGLAFLNDGWLWKITGKNLYPQVKEKQEVLTAYFKDKLMEWEEFQTPEAHKIISETEKQIQRLDEEFNHLKSEFERTGNRFVLDAMVENTKQKNELLENMREKLIQVEKMKRYEKQSHSL